jgi:hypothetical protein
MGDHMNKVLEKQLREIAQREEYDVPVGERRKVKINLKLNVVIEEPKVKPMPTVRKMNEASDCDTLRNVMSNDQGEYCMPVECCAHRSHIAQHMGEISRAASNFYRECEDSANRAYRDMDQRANDIFRRMNN